MSPPENESPASLETAMGSGRRKTASLAEQFSALANPRRLDLLRFVVQPRYVEEIASYMGLTRQGAKRHVDALLACGLIEEGRGRRPTGPVTEYRVVPPKVFMLAIELFDLGSGELKDVEGGAGATVKGPAGRRLEESRARVPGLVLAHGFGAGRRFPLLVRPETGDRWTIGRDAEAAIRLDYDPFVSGKHAEVFLEGSHYLVGDLYSTNGTFLNGNQVPRGSPQRLVAGDLVAVGRSLLVFQA